MNLTRRHQAECQFRERGRAWQRCGCPIWADGILDGRRVRLSLRTADWAQAEKRLQEIMQRPEVAMPGRATERCAEAFLAECTTRGVGRSTLGSYRVCLAHLARAIPTMEGCTIERLAEFRAGRRGRGEQPLSPRTGRKELEILRAFFSFCVGRSWMTDNPARSLRAPIVRDIGTRPLDAGELDRILDACGRLDNPNPAWILRARLRARALCLLLIYSGLRISDAANLMRRALEPKTGYLRLRTEKTGAHVQVKLPDHVVAALDSMPHESDEYFFRSGSADLKTTVGSLRRTLNAVGRLAGLHLHPHRFRDTFAVELLSNGADIRSVQLLLGHESLRTTERHYAHFVAAHQALLDSATARLPHFGGKAARPLLLKRKQR